MRRQKDEIINKKIINGNSMQIILTSRINISIFIMNDKIKHKVRRNIFRCMGFDLGFVMISPL